MLIQQNPATVDSVHTVSKWYLGKSGRTNNLANAHKGGLDAVAEKCDANQTRDDQPVGVMTARALEGERRRVERY